MSENPIRRYAFDATLLVLCALYLIASPAWAAEKPPRADATLEHPLEPPDTSSPRATLQTFLNYARDGWSFFLEHGRAHPDSDKHTGCCLDLSKVPVKRQNDVDTEGAIMLFDVFNRIWLPGLADVPDENSMDNEKETRWTIPHTSITIARVENGPRTGEWLFTPDTVENIPDFYRRTRHLPLKPDAVIEDGYSLYQGQAGWMLPASWQTALPGVANKVIFEQTLWQWFMLLVTLTLAALLARIVTRWSRRSTSDMQPPSMRTLAGPVIVMLLTSVLDYFIDEQVNITGVLLGVLQQLFDTVFYLAMIWGVVLAGRLLVSAIVTLPRMDLTRLSADFVRLSVRILTFAVVLLVIAMWLNSIGIPVLGVLAGLGIGGIAVALAAQRTIENFFGAIMLYSDRPVRIGDFCRFGDKMGTVERIGLRSTRIRTPERSILNVPNAEFSRLQLENLAQRDKFLLKTTLNLRLETTPEQLQLVLYRVGTLLQENDRVYDEPLRVRLVTIGPLSLDIEIFAYVKTEDMNSFLAIREDLFLEILREVEAAGTALAPPAQIQYNESALPVGANVAGSSDS